VKRMEKEINYFASFPEELKKYRGKHVAIIGDKVVASEDNAIEVYKKAKETENCPKRFSPKMI